MTLLSEVLEAHGGRERWHAAPALRVEVAAGGLAFASKGRGLGRNEFEALVSTGAPRTEFRDYPSAGSVGVFEGGDVRIERDGEVVERRERHGAWRSARRSLRWDDLDLLYFNGYALWQYMAAPFVFAEPDFETDELEPWTEGGESWRRLRVRFPERIPAHSREQVYYYDARAMLRRHDYTAEVFGRWARAVHYCEAHRELGGFWVATRRRVHPRMAGGRALRPVVLVAIEIASVQAAEA